MAPTSAYWRAASPRGPRWRAGRRGCRRTPAVARPRPRGARARSHGVGGRAPPRRGRARRARRRSREGLQREPVLRPAPRAPLPTSGACRTGRASTPPARPGRGRRSSASRIARARRRSPEQLPRICDPRVAAQAGPDRDHAVEGREGLRVAAELELRVADHAVRLGDAGRLALGGPAEAQRLAEAVARQRKRGEAGGGVEVARCPRQRAAERPLRARESS